MSDFTLEPRHTLIVGMTGSGKTTFVNRYLLNTGEPTNDDPKPACIFIYDDLNRVWPRLNVRPCYTAAEMEAALITRLVIHNHERMWPLEKFIPARGMPTPAHAGFRSFTRWIGNVAKRGPGRKIVCLPEMWRWCTEDALPLEFALLAQAGREDGIELVLDTQVPENLNSSITGACTELVCFKLASADALNAVKKLGADKDKIAALPPGQFIAYNRLSGGVRTGKVF